MVNRSHNTKAIGQILNHPRVYGMVSDDCSPDPFLPPEGGFYIVNDAETGVVRLDQAGAMTCAAHIATLPVMRGKAKMFVKDALDWGFQNTLYTKVIALIPEFNRLAIKLCDDCGFSREGISTKSFLKNWKMHDQILFGITKTEFYGG